MLAVNPLGRCPKCKCDLHVSGQEVVCSRCGHIVAGHELTRKKPESTPSNFEVKASDYPATDHERLIQLEKRHAATMAVIERRLQILEAVGKSKKTG